MSLALETYAATGEAASAMRARRGARYLGGGTLLVRALNEGDLAIETLIRATAPDLSAITLSAGRVTIGAAVTMAAISARPELGALARAASGVGGPAVRNMATIGGNLFAPPPYGDLGAPLLALDATIASESDAGPEEIPLEAFYARREHWPPGTIVTAVSCSRARLANLRFLKVSRVRPKGSAVLTIAAVLTQEQGAVTAATIALGGMAATPMRARATEKALLGRPLTRDGIRPALAAALDGTSPPTDAIASAWYRRAVLPVHLGRLLVG
ncbi:MAG: FAD binding domain-containing protein [Acetobacteraceae bacterium]